MGYLSIAEKLSTHDGCPFITGSFITWSIGHHAGYFPLIRGSPIIGVALEYRFYHINHFQL